MNITRDRIEDFLYHEAALLDEWRLDEWLALLTEDAEYEVPSTDAPGASCKEAIALVYDDHDRIAARVKQYTDGLVFAENPRSRVRRMISNVRVLATSTEGASIAANFVVYRFAHERMDVFVGHLEYELVEIEGKLRIKKRRVVLDIEALRPHGMLSIIL